MSVTNSSRETAARAIHGIVFYSLLAVIALVPIPYGSVQPWWKSLFHCLAFALSALSVVQELIRHQRSSRCLVDYRVFWPILALIAFAFLQTLPWPGSIAVGTHGRETLSADPFQTRQFVIHLLAFLLVGWLLIRHTSSPKRLRCLVDLVIAVGTISAVFGLWRQASQRAPGFVLPHLLPGRGYAQFINPNHFAYLMEMALGLALGIVVCRGVKGRRLAIYLIAVVPMWIALILANSKGGILSILCQVLFLALLLSANRDSQLGEEESDKFLNRLIRVSRTVAVRGVLIAALLAGAVTTVVLVGGDPLARRVDSLANELERSRDESYTTRPSIWRTTWKLIEDNPLAGVGFGGYWIAITKYHSASGESTPQEAHNDYLDLLAGGGLIGLAIVVWFTVALVRSARRKLRNAETYTRSVTLGALAGILTVAIHSLVDFGLHITINALVFTVLVSIVCMNEQSET